MPAWPASLPVAPLHGAINMTSEPNRAELKPDVGKALRRKRYTAKLRLFNVNMLLTMTQMETLESFFAADCGEGALSFTMLDWLNKNTLTFEFMGEPTYEHVALDRWRVSLSVARLYTPPVASFSAVGTGTMTAIAPPASAFASEGAGVATFVGTTV